MLIDKCSYGIWRADGHANTQLLVIKFLEFTCSGTVGCFDKGTIGCSEKLVSARYYSIGVYYMIDAVYCSYADIGVAGKRKNFPRYDPNSSGYDQ